VRGLAKPLTLIVAVALSGCGKGDQYVWSLPDKFPRPSVPADNPMTNEKVALGRALFYDTRLSINELTSCASCHRQELAFTDGRPVAIGTTGEHHVRSAMSLVNVAYNARYTWANPLVDTLEHQALMPMFGDKPVEMGLAGREQEMLKRLSSDPKLRVQFVAAFPGDSEPVTVAHIVKAIASFERTIISADTPFDRFMRGDETALSPAALRGMTLFYSERLECFHCHGGFNFTDSSRHGEYDPTALPYHNTGLYNEDGSGAYPKGNAGVIDVSNDPRDMGKFRAPTLRNIALTAPYMHDGSIATLEAVLDHYAAGGRARTKTTSEFVPGFILSDAEKQDVIEFLKNLTDEALLRDPRFGPPQ
jgi:cytochrome c peroxidase